MYVSFYTLGCKVNQYESGVLASLFKDRGFLPAIEGTPADVYVINSCTVTGTGDKKTKQAVNRARRQNPDAVIVLTGCFPQAYPEKSAGIITADIITGTVNRSRIPLMVTQFLTDHRRVVDIGSANDVFEDMSISYFEGHTRAFVKIQDGCDCYCSYCVVPYARGPVRSKALTDLIDEIKGLAKAGYKEVVLSGINLSKYGKDSGISLANALEAACSVEGIERVRLGSLEPHLIDDDMIAAFEKQDKLCPQFHISLQSGCDTVLQRMNRRYDTAQYAALIEKLKGRFKNCAITTDIMVGFPGETEDEFRASLTFAETMGFAKVHVFPYSRREGTKAAAMDGQIEKSEKEKRAGIMTGITDKSREKFMLSQIGMSAEVLFENCKNGVYTGYTKNYTPVSVVSKDGLSGKIKTVRITGYNGELDCVEGWM